MFRNENQQSLWYSETGGVVGEDSEHGRYGPSACRDIGASTGKTGRLRLTQRRGAGFTWKRVHSRAWRWKPAGVQKTRSWPLRVAAGVLTAPRQTLRHPLGASLTSNVGPRASLWRGEVSNSLFENAGEGGDATAAPSGRQSLPRSATPLFTCSLSLSSYIFENTSR